MGFLLDVDYRVNSKTEALFFTERGVFKYIYDPYFYIDKNQIVEIEEKGQRIKPIKIEKTIKKLNKDKRVLYKVYVNTPAQVVKFREVYKRSNINTYEVDIPYKKRVIDDFQLTPLNEFILEKEPLTKEDNVYLIKMAFDIEVYNKNKAFPNPEDNEIIMISYVSPTQQGVISTKPSKFDFVQTVKNEKMLLETFFNTIEKINPDVLIGYNSSMFDLPFIIERAKKLKVDVKLTRYVNKIKKINKGMTKGLYLGGRIHIDLFPIVKRLGKIGAINLEKYTLYEVYNELIGKNKLMVDREKIWQLWEKGEETLFKYSLSDSIATYEISEKLLPLEIELAKLTHSTLFDTSLSTTGQLVESMLMYYSIQRGEIIPNRPKFHVIEERYNNPIKGAFVKIPSPGIYENIAVFDFSSLYPSLIITYNIDPNTIDPNGIYTAPTGTAFRKEPMGLIPYVTDMLFSARMNIKEQLKHINPDSKKYKNLYVKSQALKIIANTIYGYMVYPKSRWYCRECGSAITAWARHHIQKAESIAKAKGFDVLYIDTDSLFIHYKDKTKEDVIKLLNEINKNLPGKMRLDLENFYKRGLFIAKRTEKTGAKKKYALIDEKGRIKIRGFELVRRDWSIIARETQRKVLEIILKEGEKEKAINYVRNVIKDIRKNNVPLEKMVIQTQISKNIWEYDIISPEVMAAKRLEKKGIPIKPGMIISYVITKNGKTISEKSYPVSLADNYDPEYYINNQIVPSTLKILKELKVKEEELTAINNKTINDYF